MLLFVKMLEYKYGIIYILKLIELFSGSLMFEWGIK